MLSSVLEAAPFLFSIKMAAVASQKDYLNLEKWLDDNMSMHKDGFFEVIYVSFTSSYLRLQLCLVFSARFHCLSVMADELHYGPRLALDS